MENNLSKVHLALVFKDFAMWLRSSCVGLNVASYATAAVLRKAGIDTEVFPVRNNIDLVDDIEKYNSDHSEKLTHIVISAPWLSIFDLTSLIEAYPDTQFVVLSHSNIGFLHADPDAVCNIKRYVQLAETHNNLRIGGNSAKFVWWLRQLRYKDAVVLPNLYPLDRDSISSKIWRSSSRVIKIGAFGAARVLKNFMTAAAAAVAIHKTLNIPVELHMNTGGESGTIEAIEQMCAGIDGFTIVKHEWQYWDDFIKLVSSMDLLIQVSYTESFNMVTADGVSVGVPSVVSTAIEWAPKEWKADSDNVASVTQTGIDLLLGSHSTAGLVALERHNQIGLRYWFEYLEGEK